MLRRGWPEIAPAVLRLVTAPAQEPVTLAEAKERLRITGDSFDADLAALLRAARQDLDGNTGWLGRALITQTWELVLSSFPTAGWPIEVPLPPLQSVVSVSYIDVAGATKVVAPADYRVLNRGTAAALLEAVDDWATDVDLERLDPIIVRFVAGYGDTPVDVPEPIRAWIIAMAGALFAQPEALSVGVQAFKAPYFATMLNSYRVWK
jgi:uncharacterized phiE125 gp8 family phage protein